MVFLINDLELHIKFEYSEYITFLINVITLLLDDALKDITPQVLARREKQREVVFQHGVSGQQPQPNRNVPREFTLRQNSGAAQDYYVTLVVVVDYSIYMR